MAGSKKRVAVNMIAQMLTFGVGIGINFYLAPFITKNVGKEVYGFVNLAFQMTGYIAVFTKALNAMLGRFITINIGKKDYNMARMYFSSARVANVLIAMVMFVPVVLSIVFLDQWINVSDKNLLDVQLLWAFIFFDFFATLVTNGYEVSTYSTNRLDLSARRNMESNILRAVLLFVLFAFMPSNVWYVGFTKAITGLYVIASNFYFTKKLTPELYFDKALVRFSAVKKLVETGIWNSVQQLNTILINGCDTLITNLYIDAASMTLMSFAKTIPNYVMTIIGIVCGSFGPQMTLLYAEEDTEKFVDYVKSAIKVCGFICSVPILGFVVFGTHFFSLWLPILTSGEIHVVQILSVMILAQTIFDVYIYPLYTVNQITARLKIPVLVSTGIGIANVFGSILLCVHTSLGIYAIQIVSSVLLTARVVFFAPLYAAYILEQKWWTFYMPLIRGTCSSVIVVGVFAIIERVAVIDSWISLFLIVMICGILGYSINYMTILNKNERIMVKNHIKKKLKKA